MNIPTYTRPDGTKMHRVAPHEYTSIALEGESDTTAMQDKNCTCPLHPARRKPL